MKYIRTKGNRIGDRILKVDYEEYSYFNCKDEIIIKEEVLKQTDTIEELCDEFVVKGCDNEYFINNHFFDAKYYGIDYIRESNETYEFYGAIWTDKGLIYVAKMNDKGELELL